MSITMTFRQSKTSVSFGGYLTGTFFCVAKTAVSTPLTATDVRPPWLIALKAYSTGKFSINHNVYRLRGIKHAESSTFANERDNRTFT